MEIDSQSFGAGKPAVQSEAQDAEGVAATLLLREVEDYLREGQPRHAIAHIVEVTGVGREQAASFVAEYQSGVFAKSA
ncbi:MAG: hypothetical protein V3V15_03545 [Sphingorhabdus sp.]